MLSYKIKYISLKKQIFILECEFIKIRVGYFLLKEEPNNKKNITNSLEQIVLKIISNFIFTNETIITVNYIIFLNISR